jgi:hypothetical protein
VVRGADSDFAAWDESAMDQLTQALLLQHLVQGYSQPEAVAQHRLQAALAPLQPAFTALWRSRKLGAAPRATPPSPRPSPPSVGPGDGLQPELRPQGPDATANEREVLARGLQPLLASAVRHALGGPV